MQIYIQTIYFYTVFLSQSKQKKPPRRILKACGAENGARTRDLNLGKVALYQLSYFRIGTANILRFF